MLEENYQIKSYQGNNNQQVTSLFGYQIPFLPDFLSDHTLMGETLPEKLTEVLKRFERFVIGLRKFRGSSYSLRFIYDPESGSVSIYLLGKVVYSVSSKMDWADQLASDVSSHLSSYGLAHILIPAQTKVGSQVTLEEILKPFQGDYPILEIRQHEQVVPLVTVGKEAYIIHPYWRAAGSCLEPFETMVRQRAPVALSIFIQPTEVTSAELDSLSEAAFMAQTLADVNVKTYSETSIQRRRDPGAELVGRIYSAYLQSLNEPFIMTVQVASPDANAAWTLARSYASSMTESTDDFHGIEQRMPSGTDIVTATKHTDHNIARRIFENLSWEAWGESKATEGKERLPYLMGTQGVNVAFRFPVSVNGGVPGISVRQLPPDFEPGPRPAHRQTHEIHLGNFHRGGMATIPIKALTRHALITGFTGSGKTNTVLYLLDQVWKQQHIPFLVIEAAKKEYRSLARVSGFKDELLIFTLGDETTSPFRLNPFELLPGVRLEAHLGRLQACFDAALPQFGILPSIVAEAMEEIYKERKWKLTDMGSKKDTRLFPTMRDMFSKVIQVAETRGYAGDTYHNIRAAAAGRIGSLLRGSRGKMFGCQHSYPADILFSQPVIFEMNDLNQDDKALTMMFLLTWLREYRELHGENFLQHLTVIEEAHNVLSNTQSVGSNEVSADTKAKAVAAFSDMLAEVRAYGEGLVISDQSPEKLAPDAMRNTNLQIAHQLRDRHDREAISRAMIMDEMQQEYLGKLRIGEAALFYTGIEKATFVQIPEYKDSAGFDSALSDLDVYANMKPFLAKYQHLSLPFDGCSFCGHPCEFAEMIEPHTFDKDLHKQFIRALKRFDDKPDPDNWAYNWEQVARVCMEPARRAGLTNVDAGYCFLVHEIDFPFTKHMRQSFVRAVDIMQND
jgi:hypothetical protein